MLKSDLSEGPACVHLLVNYIFSLTGSLLCSVGLKTETEKPRATPWRSVKDATRARQPHSAWPSFRCAGALPPAPLESDFISLWSQIQTQHSSFFPCNGWLSVMCSFMGRRPISRERHGSWWKHTLGPKRRESKFWKKSRSSTWLLLAEVMKFTLKTQSSSTSWTFMIKKNREVSLWHCHKTGKHSN